MVKLTSAVLLVTAVSALPSSWVRRDVNTVLNNLGTIDTETDALTTSVDAWDGSFFGALGIASASNTLGTAIDSANTEAATEAQLSSADTQTFITYLTGTINPDVTASLDALSDRIADVQALGLTSLVLSQIQSLQAKTDALGATLVSISSADLQATTQTAVDALDAAFGGTIEVYS